MPFNGAGSNLSGAGDVFFSTPVDGQQLKFDGTSQKWQNSAGAIPFATFSMPGTLATGTIPLPFPVNGTWKFGALFVNVGTASAGASIIVDLQYNGSTVFTTTSNRPAVTAGTAWASSATANVTQFTGSTSVRGYLQFSVAQVGSAGTEGSDLVATLYATRIA